MPLEEIEVVIQPTVQAPPPADRQPDPAPSTKSLFRCIPCDCYTTLVHSPLLVFACSLSAGYFGVSLTFSLLLIALGEIKQDEDLFLVSCSDRFNASMCAADVDKEVAQAESGAIGLHLTALILALLINNKWLKCQCTALPKMSLCAEVAVCLLTGVMGLAAFIAWTAEVSTCFSCKLGENTTDIDQSLLSVMRFESFLGVITSLFMWIAVAWMALGRVPWITKLFRGHAYLADHEASMIRHLLTSRVYIGLLVGLLVNIAVVIYFGSTLHGWLAILDGWRSWLPDWLARYLSSLIGSGAEVGAAAEMGVAPGMARGAAHLSAFRGGQPSIATPSRAHVGPSDEQSAPAFSYRSCRESRPTHSTRARARWPGAVSSGCAAAPSHRGSRATG